MHPVYTSCVHLRKLIDPGAVMALAVSLFHTRAVLQGKQSAVSTLQDQQSEGKEVSRLKWETVMVKLRHAILALGKSCNTLPPC